MTRDLLGLMGPPHLAKIEAARAAGRRAVGVDLSAHAGWRAAREIRFDGLANALRTPGGGFAFSGFC